jgi:transposase
MQEALFSQALGLIKPWEVEQVLLDTQANRIDLHIAWRAQKATCPACGAADQPVHDHRQRSWRHLDFFQFEAHVHCQLPRIQCRACQATSQLVVPWARPGSHFTLMFEALALTLAREMPVAACQRILRCSANALWRQIDAHIDLARAQEDYSDVTVIGIDETSCAKGQDYITLMHDLGRPRLIFATPGKDSTTLERFCADLQSRKGQPERIEVVCMDMSKAFIHGVGKYLPGAAIAFDRFHVIQMANKAVDLVRREEAASQDWLKKTRWCWVKDKSKWTDKEADKMAWLAHTRLKTARAWRIKEALRDIYAQRASASESLRALKRWLRWAQRSQLHPIQDFARTIKSHWAGIVQSFERAFLHNGYAEAVNSLIQAAKAKARGYGTPRHFIAMAFLIAGKLTHLPVNPLMRAAPKTVT